jgi:uncharacterized protein YndB with AHSA1/START domain
MGSWWPPEHHILAADLAEMVFEPREGGHVYDRGVDGSECHWARVLAYEPPNRFVISWELEHRNLERHGEGWEQMRDLSDRPTDGATPCGSSPTPRVAMLLQPS